MISWTRWTGRQGFLIYITTHDFLYGLKKRGSLSSLSKRGDDKVVIDVVKRHILATKSSVCDALSAPCIDSLKLLFYYGPVENLKNGLPYQPCLGGVSVTHNSNYTQKKIKEVDQNEIESVFYIGWQRPCQDLGGEN